MNASRQRLEGEPATLAVYLAVGLAGATALGLEVSAPRLLAPTFGSSNLVWSNVIGLILAYFAVGSFLGGRLADRGPSFRTFFALPAAAGLAIALTPQVAALLLPATARLVAEQQGGVVIGSLVATATLYLGPVVLLGMLPPYAIRLEVRELGRAGRTAGQLSAISTIGGLCGTFLTALWLVPSFGVQRTLAYLGGVTLFSAALGLATAGRSPALAGAAALAGAGILACPPGEPAVADGLRRLFVGESPYAHVEVLEIERDLGRLPAGTRLLLSDDGAGIQSLWHPERVIRTYTLEMLSAPFTNEPPFGPRDVRSVLILGLGAGSVAHQVLEAFGPDVHVDGVELDPLVVELGHRFFRLGAPRVSTRVEDGRVALRSSRRRYDLIAVDVYRMPYIPWHMATVEFFKEVRTHLGARGVVVLNVTRGTGDSVAGEDRRLLQALTRTMQNVFPSVHTLDVGGSLNSLLVGSLVPTKAENLRANLELLPGQAPPLLDAALRGALDDLAPTVAGPTTFTDDRANVEALIDSMLLRRRVGGRSALQHPGRVGALGGPEAQRGLASATAPTVRQRRTRRPGARPPGSTRGRLTSMTCTDHVSSRRYVAILSGGSGHRAS